MANIVHQLLANIQQSVVLFRVSLQTKLSSSFAAALFVL